MTIEVTLLYDELQLLIKNHINKKFPNLEVLKIEFTNKPVLGCGATSKIIPLQKESVCVLSCKEIEPHQYEFR